MLVLVHQLGNKLVSGGTIWLLILHNRARSHFSFSWTIASIMKYYLLARLAQTLDLYLHFFVLHFLILLLGLLPSLYSFASPHSTNISRRMHINFSRNIATCLVFLVATGTIWTRGASMLNTLDVKKSKPSFECTACWIRSSTFIECTNVLLKETEKVHFC